MIEAKKKRSKNITLQNGGDAGLRRREKEGKASDWKQAALPPKKWSDVESFPSIAFVDVRQQKKRERKTFGKKWGDQNITIFLIFQKSKVCLSEERNWIEWVLNHLIFACAFCVSIEYLTFSLRLRLIFPRFRVFFSFSAASGSWELAFPWMNFQYCTSFKG